MDVTRLWLLEPGQSMWRLPLIPQNRLATPSPTSVVRTISRDTAGRR
jgi:hypothetical protein